ncbi:MAG: hypothetical protein AAFR65_01775 [Pseudomonadota bacterium]
MDALLYLLSLGFSGSDLTRALILVLLGSLFVSARFQPWKMTLLILVIDLLWPYYSMLQDGVGMGVVVDTLAGYADHWQDNAVGLAVRWAGFYVFIRGMFSFRRKLHNALPEEKKAGSMSY